jgi:hypothetical protein
MPSLALTVGELAEGTWLERVPELLAMPKAQDRRTNGSAAAAGLIRELLPGR